MVPTSEAVSLRKRPPITITSTPGASSNACATARPFVDDGQILAVLEALGDRKRGAGRVEEDRVAVPDERGRRGADVGFLLHLLLHAQAEG